MADLLRPLERLGVFDLLGAEQAVVMHTLAEADDALFDSCFGFGCFHRDDYSTLATNPPYLR